MELIKGRPADETGRLEKEIRVYDLLDKLGMEYYRTDHEPVKSKFVCKFIFQLCGFIYATFIFKRFD